MKRLKINSAFFDFSATKGGVSGVPPWASPWVFFATDIMTVRELEKFLKTVKNKDMEVKIRITDEEDNISFGSLEDCFDEDDEQNQKVIILSGYCEDYQSGF